MNDREMIDLEDRCPYCDGRGYVTADCTMDAETGEYVESRCWYCEGYGYA